MYRSVASITGPLLTLLLPLSLFADSPKGPTAEVSARVASYLQAFNARDLDACAEHWSESAEYVIPGSDLRIQGREAIREALEELLKTSEALQLSVSGQRFRAASPGTVLEEGTATLLSQTRGIEQANYLVVHVKKDQTWYRDSVRETRVPAAEATSKLHELEWLLGDWTHEGESGSTEIHAEWIHNRRFISRSFHVHSQDGGELTGTQIIGWDPSAGAIRSWSFDSEGGYEQAFWHRDGDAWSVKVNAVLPDGSVASEQRVLSVGNDGNLTRKVVQQQVAGRLLPVSLTTTFTRQSQ